MDIMVNDFMNKLNKYILLVAVSLMISGCVSDQYPTMSMSEPGKQRQPWGDNTFWPYYWRSSEQGKRLIRKNRIIEEFYRTNKWEGFNTSTNK